MHNRLMAGLVVSIILTSVVGLRELYNATAQPTAKSSTVTQTQARIIVTNKDPETPVEILAIKAKKRELQTDTEFLDDEDWLKGFTIRVANRSTKSITFVEVFMFFHRTKDQTAGLTAGWPLIVGIDPFPPRISGQVAMQPVEPGNEIELVVSDIEYAGIKSFLKDVHFPQSVKKVELQIVKIGFDDDTAWNSGYMYRRDPRGADGPGPIKGWIRVKEPGPEKPQVRRTGSTEKRTAFLMKSNVREVDLGATWRFLKVGWHESLVQSNESAKLLRWAWGLQ